MNTATQKPFNPCDINEDSKIPVKIWELLRRNRSFRDDVQRLTKLYTKVRNDWAKTGNYHGSAWQKACRLVKRVEAHHPFAGVALQWLVPEPFFHVRRVAWPLAKNWRKRPVFSPRVIQLGEGTTPNMRDKEHWCWRNYRQANREANRPRGSPTDEGRLITRAPQVRLTISRFRRLADKVNPILEWKRFDWPFTVEHSWSDA